jgi:four helix bundle protein
MNSDELRQRTKKFALNIIRFIDLLSNDKTTTIIGKQLVRAATSVGRIIELLAELDQRQISYLKLQLLKKKQTSVSIGSSYYKI